MPIYDQGYRRYEARAALHSVRFWPITREALRLLLAKRAFLGLLMVAWVPFLVRVVQVYVITRFPEAGRVLPVNAQLFGTFLNQQLGFVILLSVFGGAGLVANDLRTGAVLVYLSRPLTRRDYVLGKLGVLLALNLSATLAPALLLYLLSLALAPEIFLAWSLGWIGPAIVLHALLLSLVIGLLALAVSSLSKSARVAGLGFFGLLLGLDLARGLLWVAYRSPFGALVSIEGTLRSVGNALFGISERGVQAPWAAAAAVLALLAAGCLWVLRVRVRAVEVVS
jgi:ABC-2 type transport system permease protein